MYFAPSDREEMKVRERVMLDRKSSGYYMCKIKHKHLQDGMMRQCNRYIERTMLVQLNHPYSTQKNEVIHTSASVFAPKNKNYASDSSLRCMVGIAAGTQISGYVSFLNSV